MTVSIDIYDSSSNELFWSVNSFNGEAARFGYNGKILLELKNFMPGGGSCFVLETSGEGQQTYHSKNLFLPVGIDENGRVLSLSNTLKKMNNSADEDSGCLKILYGKKLFVSTLALSESYDDLFKSSLLELYVNPDIDTELEEYKNLILAKDKQLRSIASSATRSAACIAFPDVLAAVFIFRLMPGGPDIKLPIFGVTLPFALFMSSVYQKYYQTYGQFLEFSTLPRNPNNKDRIMAYTGVNISDVFETINNMLALLYSVHAKGQSLSNAALVIMIKTVVANSKMKGSFASLPTFENIKSLYSSTKESSCITDDGAGNCCNKLLQIIKNMLPTICLDIVSCYPAGEAYVVFLATLELQELSRNLLKLGVYEEKALSISIYMLAFFSTIAKVILQSKFELPKLIKPYGSIKPFFTDPKTLVGLLVTGKFLDFFEPCLVRVTKNTKINMITFFKTINGLVIALPGTAIFIFQIAQLMNSEWLKSNVYNEDDGLGMYFSGDYRYITPLSLSVLSFIYCLAQYNEACHQKDSIFIDRRVSLSVKEIKGIIIDVILTAVLIGVMHLTNSIPDGYFEKILGGSLAALGAVRSRSKFFQTKDDNDIDGSNGLGAKLLGADI